MHILRLDSSASGSESVTNRLNALLVDSLGADASVVHRDVSQLPSLTTERFAANGTPVDARSAELAVLAELGDELIQELEASDVVVIGAPIYNFGVPSGLKAWMDLVARVGRTFRYTETGPEGLVTGKKAYIVTASGGVPLGSEADFASPHLQTFLGFLGFTDIAQIDATGLQIDATKIQQAEAQIHQLAAA